MGMKVSSVCPFRDPLGTRKRDGAPTHNRNRVAEAGQEDVGVVNERRGIFY